MKRFGLSWLLLLFVLIAAVPGFAQLAKLDVFLKGLEEEGTYSGSVLVVRGGAPVFRGYYGFRDEAQTQKNDAASVYYTPGIDETILATLAMMAQERGLISLDAPLGTYVPEFRDKPGPRVRDLLCHAAGFPVFRLDEGRHAGPGTLTLAALAAGTAERPALVSPGTHFDREEKDYDLLGYLLELVTGKPFPAVLSEWILEPLGLKHSGAGLRPAGKELAWTSRLTKFQAGLARWKGGYQPSGCVYSTLDELELFLGALASGKLVSAKSYQAMQTPIVNDGPEGIGLGIAIRPSGALWNVGLNEDGYRSLFLHDPRQDLRIVILGNKWMSLTGKSLAKTLLPEIYASLGLKE